MNNYVKILLMAIALPLLFSSAMGQGLIADHTCTGYWDQIPDAIIEQIVDEYDIYYVHTSHGGQIITGFTALNNVDERFPDLNYYPYEIIYEVGDDLGYDSDTSWAAPTRSYLDGRPECNMVMYSWCGGVSSNSEEGIDIYLDKMTELESQYPGVQFVYMTGHLDGSGPSGNLYQRNNQIREYCRANNKVLFDFADIESYDPAGNYYPNGSDACEWCYDWCGEFENGCDNSCYCAHSHCFNCRLKSQTWWVMMALLSGWQITSVEEDNTPIPSSYYLFGNYPNPFNASTIIKYEIPFATPVRIDIYSIDGRLIETPINSVHEAGVYQFTWDGNDHAAGVYLARLGTSSYSDCIKLMLLK